VGGDARTPDMRRRRDLFLSKTASNAAAEIGCALIPGGKKEIFVSCRRRGSRVIFCSTAKISDRS